MKLHTLSGKISFVVFFFLLNLCFAQQTERSIPATNLKIDSLFLNAVSAIENTEFDKSIQKLEEARSLAEQIDNKSRVALSSSLLAKIYFRKSSYSMAAEEVVKAIRLHRTLEENLELGSDYLLYAQILIATGQAEKALPYLEEAKSIYQESDDALSQNNLSSVYLNIGNAYQELNKNQEAVESYRKAGEILQQQNNNPFLSARLAIQKARTFLKTKDFDQGIQEANTAYNISVRNNFPQIEVDALSLLSELNAEKGNFKEAYKYLGNYNTKNKLYFNNPESDAKELALKNSLLAELDADEFTPGKRVQANKITTVLVIALFTILCLLALSLYKNNNLRTKANELLQAKNTELLIAKENAEKASVVKAQFLSTITHELRTPMYAVTGLTHLLLSENPTEEQKKHLDSLKFSGEYLLSLINNILDLNKLEANKVEVERTTFNLRKRVDDVLFALERSAQEKGNTLKLEFDRDIPEQIVGDPLMISQILINLIGNGNKFTRDGEIFIRVQKISQNDSQVYLHFEVEDTGEGISKKKQKDIFQNFTQGSVQINRKFGGTGLGLSIVKRLLDLQKSKIQLESTLGLGSKFFFDIKYNLPESAANRKNDEKVYDIDYKALEGRKVLVVEDNKINQMITRKILEKNKIECDVADNGEIAVEKVRFESYDLVLMDIHMPGISGIEATQKIREFNKDLPILALTAVTIDENIDDFYIAGFNDIIPKPYKIEEFFSKIHTALKRSVIL